MKKASLFCFFLILSATAHAATVASSVDIGVAAGTNALIFDANGTDTETYTLTGLTVISGAITVTFDLELQLTGGNGNYFNNLSQAETANEFLILDEPTDILTFVVTNVVPGATFDGFTSYGAFSNTNGDSQAFYMDDAGIHVYAFTANGTTYSTPQNFTLVDSPSSVLTIRARTSGFHAISQLGVQFTVVPEPSVTGLVGIGSMLAVLRRRRF